MRFLADENLPWPVTQRLISEGFAVQLVGGVCLSMPDSEILSRAARDQVIVTEDKDFGDLVFRDRIPSRGVLLVRLEGVSLERRAELVAEAVKIYGDRLVSSFTVISHGGIRRQPLPDAARDEGDSA